MDSLSLYTSIQKTKLEFMMVYLAHVCETLINEKLINADEISLLLAGTAWLVHGRCGHAQLGRKVRE